MNEEDRVLAGSKGNGVLVKVYQLDDFLRNNDSYHLSAVIVCTVFEVRSGVLLYLNCDRKSSVLPPNFGAGNGLLCSKVIGSSVYPRSPIIVNGDPGVFKTCKDVRGGSLV